MNFIYEFPNVKLSLQCHSYFNLLKIYLDICIFVYKGDRSSMGALTLAYKISLTERDEELFFRFHTMEEFL